MKTITISWACVRLALGQIESGNNDHAVGRCGEVSRYQITRDNWSLFACGKPTSERKAWSAARCIFEHRLYSLAGRSALRPRELYALWHRPGVYYRTGCRFDLLPKRIRERCIRFENLYDDARRKQHSHRR